MKLLIDCADVKQIQELYEAFPLSGVTCNPTILRKAGRRPYDALREIRAFIGSDDLHVQIVSRDTEGMLLEAKEIVRILGKDTYIKIPVDTAGLTAIKKLHAQGYRVTATAVYNSMQAYLAAEAGTDYCAPYVNRIEKAGQNGVAVACEIHDMFVRNQYPCKVLGASFHRADQVLGLALYGAYSATVSYELLKELLVSPQVDQAIEAFVTDYEALVGQKATMLYETEK